MQTRRQEQAGSEAAQGERSTARAKIFHELLALNLRDELVPDQIPTSDEMHTAFVRALHATVWDMPASLDGDRTPVHEPEVLARAKPARRWRLPFHAVITVKAAAVALLLRMTLFFGTGH